MKDHSKLIGTVINEQEDTIRTQDTLLYALALGFGSDPLDQKQLQYVYETNLKSLPGMAMIVAYPGFWMKEPQYGFEWQKVLHAEESVEIYEPLPTEGRIKGVTVVEDVVDRGKEKGCFVYLRKDLHDAETGRHLASVTSNTLARGDGGFGGGGQARAPMPSVPDRAPDTICDLPTLPQNALLYRLCGDMNPLHADPEIAKDVGFEAPILHGRCTMGIAMHAVVKTCCDYDSARLRKIQLRFTSPFLPGETLRTSIWKEDETVFFKSESIERNVVVLNNGSCTVLNH